MIKVPVEIIFDKIKQKTNLSDADIKVKIKKKLDQLSGLISEEGAAHIVANELGVKLFEDIGQLQIKNILPGMRNVEVLGKVLRIYDIREFETENRKGKLGSFVIGDETGVIRILAWNDKSQILEKLKPEQIVKIENGYARENNRGKTEVHLGDRSKVLVNPAGAKDIQTGGRRKNISGLQENEDNVELLGTIVQVFDPRYFEICPECGKRVREKEGKWVCDTHKEIVPSYAYVLNLFLDDGTDNIRVVLWRNQAQRLLQKTDEEIVDYKDKSFEEIKNELLGKIVKFVGRTSKNEMFGRIEFIPQIVIVNPDPEEEIRRLDEEVKKVIQEKPMEGSVEEEKEDYREEVDEEQVVSSTEENNVPRAEKTDKIEPQQASDDEEESSTNTDEDEAEEAQDNLDEEILSLEDLESLE
ncbi:hypothetical protein JW930_00105 [Candidatus Woesearchaeota archaeon]|nr:hypothetical protein [Candidatus Woesearchaeota archaeon]